MISRFTMKLIFSILYPFSTEVYATSQRTIGYGTACAIGRLGTIFMPFVLFPLMSLNSDYPFYFITLLSVIGSLAAYFLPYDTTDYYLDTKFE